MKQVQLSSFSLPDHESNEKGFTFGNDCSSNSNFFLFFPNRTQSLNQLKKGAWLISFSINFIFHVSYLPKLHNEYPHHYFMSHFFLSKEEMGWSLPPKPRFRIEAGPLIWRHNASTRCPSIVSCPIGEWKIDRKGKCVSTTSHSKNVWEDNESEKTLMTLFWIDLSTDHVRIGIQWSESDQH